jgi:hypothetical protein
MADGPVIGLLGFANLGVLACLQFQLVEGTTSVTVCEVFTFANTATIVLNIYWRLAVRNGTHDWSPVVKWYSEPMSTTTNNHTNTTGEAVTRKLDRGKVP